MDNIIPVVEDEEPEIAILFPIPLPQLNFAPAVEETGFTGPEKVALRNAIRVLSRQEHYHARQLFLNFYTEHEHILQRYRCENDKFYLKKLNQHVFWLLNSIKHIVNEGLDNAVVFNIHFTDITTRHRNQNFIDMDVTLLARYLKYYILNVLKDISSPTLVNSVTKLCNFLVVYQFGEDFNYIKEHPHLSITENKEVNEEEKVEGNAEENEEEAESDRRRQLRESLAILQNEQDATEHVIE